MTINITNPPNPPSLANPATFEQDCSAFLSWMATVAGELDGQALELSDIARGANGNGDFVRLPDGTQICWKEIERNADVWGTSEGSLFRLATAQTWTYPATFITTPVVYTAAERPNPSDTSIVGVRLGPINTTSAEYTPWASSSIGSVSKSVQISAVGRWF